MKIAIFAICRNESHNVLDFVKTTSAADYVCVLDTGSTDDTVSKLIAAGALVSEKSFDLVDFSDFRNAAMAEFSHLCYDVVLHLDLDERLPDDWRTVVENMKTNRAELVRHELSGFRTPLLRVFTKHPGKWVGKVHEGFYSESSLIMSQPPERLDLHITHFSALGKSELYQSLISNHEHELFYKILDKYEKKQYNEVVKLGDKFGLLSGKYRHLVSRYMLVAHMNTDKRLPEKYVSEYLMVDDAHTRFALSRYFMILGNREEARVHWAVHLQHKSQGRICDDTFVPQYACLETNILLENFCCGN